MPPLSEALKKPANVGEQIPVPAAQSVSPYVPPYIPNPSPGLGIASLGPPPAVFCDSSDSIRNFTRPGVSQSRFLPAPTKANPQSNAQASSVASKQLKPVQIQTNANTTAIAQAGAQPAAVTGLAVSKSVFKDSTGVLHQAIELSFTPPAASSSNLIGAFAGISVWITEPGAEPAGVPGGTGVTSPLIFLLPINGNTVTLTVQSYSVNGVDNDFSSCPTINVTLDGVTTAPAAPTIASALAPCNSGLTFSWNIVSDPAHDVIDCYRVYRNTVNNSTTATLIASVPQPATGTGTNVFTDVVAPGLVYYYWVSCENLQQLESTLTAAQSGAVQSGTVAYMGAYSGTVTYYPGASVTYSGQFYTCILQNTGNLPTNATYWQSTGSSSNDVFLGAWVITTPYVAGNQVTYSGGYYIAIASTTGDQPDISPTKWQIVGSVSTYIFLGAYNGGTSYVPGNQVTYQGSYWICISNSTGNAPSTTSAYWVLVGTSSILIGAYAGGTAYVQGNEVTYLGSVYQCILATTGHAPTDTTYWTLTGTSSIFLGAYNGATAYVAGNSVTYQNSFYLCILASTGNAPTNGTYWQLVNLNNNVFLGAYNGATGYLIGNSVTYNGNYYTCTAATTGNLPTNASYWQQIATSETYLGAYNGATAYVTGNQVSYLGSFWICILASTGNAPSISSSYWTLLGTSAILIGAYAGGTAYLQGMEVTYNGNIFQALQATIGNAPPTPPATNAYWQCIGPSTLDNLPDGTSNFSATASTLTYRPTSNPLTSTDAGSSATVSVAAWDLQTSSKGTVSYNSGSITGLTYGTLYYIYTIDGSLSGGTTTYYATLAKTTAISGTGYIFIGSIMTAVSGGPQTIGNNDGGVGAQGGGTNVLLGGATSSTSSGGTVTNPSYAIDGNITTYASISATYSSGIKIQNLIVENFAPFLATTGTVTLNIRSAGTISGAMSEITLEYSLNGGVTWTTIYDVTGSSRALTTDQISLSTAQNTALVQIRATVTTGGSAGNSCSIRFYESWITVIQ
jgi:hypothetical protein